MLLIRSRQASGQELETNDTYLYMDSRSPCGNDLLAMPVGIRSQPQRALSFPDGDGNEPCRSETDRVK